MLKAIWQWCRDQGVALVTLVGAIAWVVTILVAFVGRNLIPEPYWALLMFGVFLGLMGAGLLIVQLWLHPLLVRRTAAATQTTSAPLVTPGVAAPAATQSNAEPVPPFVRRLLAVTG